MSALKKLFFTVVSAIPLLSGIQTEAAVTTDPRACICTGDGSVLIYDVLTPSQPPATVAHVGFAPHAVAITPDGTKALVCNAVVPPGTVDIIDLTTQPYTITNHITVGPNPWAIAITPDGTKACVCNRGYPYPLDGTVSIIDLTSPSYGTTTVTLGTGAQPFAVAITPDGKQAWITRTDNGTVSIIDLTTQPYVVGPTFSVAGPFFSMAMTPDNQYAFVGSTSGQISVFDVSSHNLIQTISVGNEVLTIAITADNKYAYAGLGSSNDIIIIDLTTLPFQTSTLTLPSGVFAARCIAITPASKEAWVCATDISSTGNIYIIDVGTQNFTGPFSTGRVPSSIAITPDQAPTARFTATTNGTTVSFDGSTSSSLFGTIVKYAWDFGDGSPVQEGATPLISHTYAHQGNYTITLTVTNSSGTSLVKTFTGQTVSNNGGPSAKLTEQVFVGVSAPSKFKGKVEIKRHARKVFLHTKWTKSTSTGVSKYQIFVHKKKIFTISAHHKRRKTLRLHPQHFPHKHISDHYKHFLQRKYRIRAVNSNGMKGPFRHVKVVK